MKFNNNNNKFNNKSKNKLKNNLSNKIVVLFIVTLVLFIFIMGCSSRSTHPISGAATLKNSKVAKTIEPVEKISVRLPIPFIDGGFGPFYLAIDKGYFEEEGLDVTYNFGSAEANPIKMVITGQDEIGFIGGPDTLLVARSKGHSVKAFALYHRYSDFPVLITTKESGITRVDQLDGKKVGFYYGHISTDVLRNLFRKENVDVEEVDIGVSLNQLLAGQIDAQWWFRIPAEVVLPAKNVDVNIIIPNEYGINTHGYTFFTTEKILEENPKMLKNFMRAIIKATEYANEHPDEATLSIISRDNQLNYEIELEKLKLYNEVTVNPKELPIGYISEEILKETYARLEEEGVIKNPFDLSDAFTTEILEKAHAEI
ncbi:ABC transporter substrate-binding protein [Candidatus Woesearchaeota archaeon]|jgi:NitT/TauT family transport system substrate-binding protein|nr:ABC transporter substrate-binding protein [Candidatus Woesearchaeota archaeon]MBT6520011.1 ABC transporter substrate-binding protein [Candidatus Woesearchaeota archaeon]MBT7367742.1 ABC transporter substrate-binding protein [Candidatus Woesearchaeota archaeon]